MNIYSYPGRGGWGRGVGGGGTREGEVLGRYSGGTPVKLGWISAAKVLTLFKDRKSKIDTLCEAQS